MYNNLALFYLVKLEELMVILHISSISLQSYSLCVVSLFKGSLWSVKLHLIIKHTGCAPLFLNHSHISFVTHGVGIDHMFKKAGIFSVSSFTYEASAGWQCFVRRTGMAIKSRKPERIKFYTLAGSLVFCR